MVQSKKSVELNPCDPAVIDRNLLSGIMKPYPWFLGVTVEHDDGGAHVVVRVKSKADMAASFFVMPHLDTRICLVIHS